MEAQTLRITYQGNPGLVDALAQLLREEGVEVQPFDEAEERRDSSGVAQDAITRLQQARAQASPISSPDVRGLRESYAAAGTVTGLPL